MIPWDLGPEFDENKINSLLQILRRDEEKASGYSKEAHAPWRGMGWGGGTLAWPTHFHNQEIIPTAPQPALWEPG